MISLNKTTINHKYFSDGALDIKIDFELLKQGETNIIEWRFDNNEELIIVYYLARHLNTKGINEVELHMPYIPNARKDRAQQNHHVFSLKYFSEIINSLNFKRVIALDPHSIVSEALIDRIVAVTPEKCIQAVLDKLDDSTIMFYPDEGAVKRYANKTDREFIYGMKSRDLTTREIKSLKIEGDVDRIKDHNILMVDDICSSGNTLNKAAKLLKELGAKDIYVYVSHCENTVINSDLLNNIERLYTTNSIIRAEHPKIEIIADVADLATL